MSRIRSSLGFTMSTPPFPSHSCSLFTLGRSCPRELSAKQPLVHAITSQKISMIKRQKETQLSEMNAEAQGHTSVPLMPKSWILFLRTVFFFETISPRSSTMALHFVDQPFSKFYKLLFLHLIL